MKSTCSLALAVALVVGAGCAADRPADVLLITIDTTRADHLGCYGYPEPTTPTIDRFAEESVLFTRTFSTNPTTLPAHTSILTGTYPPYHGVRDNTTYVVDEDLTTLAEVMAAAGYETAAFVGSFVLDAQFNLDQGFATYDDRIEEGWARDEIEKRAMNAFGFAERKANMVTHSVLEWLKGLGDDPFFMWVHYFDPHEPHNPPEPHHSRFGDPYEAEIAFVDEQIGQLFAALRRAGRYDDTLIIVTSDHGEGRLDHGEPTHSLLVFDSTMHVPLIMKVPGRPGGSRVEDLASIVDIAPTVLDLVDLPIPPAFQGVSLVPSLDGPSVPADRAVYGESLVSRLACGWAELRSLRTRDEKLIFGSVPRYYRVDDDPGEVYDLASQEPEAVDGMRLRLQEAIDGWSRSGAGRSASPVDHETASKLAAMGYLVGSVEASRQVTESLDDVEGMADPHEKHFLFDLYASAMEDIRMDRHLAGISQLESIVGADPGFKEAVKGLATAYYLHAKRPDRARPLFEQTLAIDPYQEDALYFLGKILLEAGDLDGARERFEAILEFRPQSPPSIFQLGRIHLAQGDADQAVRLYETSLDIDPNFLPALIGLGAYNARRKDHAAAGEYFRRAREVDPNHPQVLYNTAIWYLQEGNTEEAMSYLAQTIAVSPADRDAHYVLGKLLAEQGRSAEARQELMTARSLATTPARVAAIDRLLAGLEE